MQLVFENSTFVVHADREGNIYRVINKATNVLEETGTSQYEAVRYAIVHQNALNDLLERQADKEGGWPSIESSVN